VGGLAKTHANINENEITIYIVISLKHIMHLILQLLLNFFKTEKMKTVFLILLSIFISVTQTYGISKNVANIIVAVQTGEPATQLNSLVKFFVFLCVVFIIFVHFYEMLKNEILLKLRQWVRVELIRLLMKSNNENFTDKNFIKLNSPINRISNVAYLFMNEFFTYLIPSVIFIFVVFALFIRADVKMATVFIIANILMMLYVVLVLPSILKMDKEYEDNVNENESHVLEILNNMDKIVYRGQTTRESDYFAKLTDTTVKKSTVFYNYVNLQETVLISMMYVIIFGFIVYIINRVKNKKMSKVLFVTFITVIMLYKEKTVSIISQMSNTVEFYGRANGVLQYYDEAISKKNVSITNRDDLFRTQIYAPMRLEFNKLVFKNVSFKYKPNLAYVLRNFNMELFLNDKIIGLTGISGRGKSTLMKLALKMYADYEGEIYIDDVNIKDIDPDYLRQNIVYVNQNSKLFDRTIVDNIMYGCGDGLSCDRNMQQIMAKYPKIRELFKDNNIYTTRVGPLGEKMSGGQRMIISVLTGLISPSNCGLVLDEPTNGLDAELKAEIIDLIRENRRKKKFIVIISHDKDIYPIMDEKREI
jgi:ABC-type bacteriocin/lantibiotic exporter with double-glycine peptidase domain